MHGRYRGGRWREGGPGAGRAGHLLEPALLCSLLEGAAHGYALVEKLGAFGMEMVPLRRVYRVMQRLEELGWVSSDWEADRTQGPPRRVYALAPEGEQALAEWMDYLRESRHAIERLLEAYEGR